MKTVVLLSGGIDSTVLLADRVVGGDECLALTFDYGQTHYREITAAEHIAKVLRAQWQFMFLSCLSGSALTGQGDIPETTATAVDTTYVPGRNIVMLAIAASYAERVGASAVLFGANRGDHAGYPDCRPEFITAMDQAIGIGTSAGVSVSAPFCTWTKTEIVEHGRELDAPLHLTWSCYRGGADPCGRCGACQSREVALCTS